MYRMLVVGCLVALVGALPTVASENKKDDSIDVEKLVGSWKYVSGMRGGDKVEKERLAGMVKVTRETFTIPGGPDAEFVMEYKVDASKSPATIDLSIKSGPVPEGKAVGIIKLDGDSMTLCYNPMGDERPKKFESTEDNGAFLFVMKRVKN